MPWALLDGLVRLVPCDDVGFHELDLIEHRSLIGQDVDARGERSSYLPERDDDSQRPFWLHYWRFLPACYPQRTGDLTSVLLWSDFYMGSGVSRAMA